MTKNISRRKLLASFGMAGAALAMNSIFSDKVNASTGTSTVLQQEYNVMEYGAKGDGITDDTTAIQSVLNFARDKGSAVIVFPDGIYNTIGQLRIHANTTMILSNNATIRRTRARAVMFLNGELGNSAYATGYDGDGNIHIVGGTFDLNSVNFPPPAGQNNKTAFSFAHAENVSFQGSTYTGAQDDHYFEMCAIKNLRILNNTFRDQVITLANEYEMVQTDLATASSFPSFGAYDNTTCEDVLIQGNTFSNGFTATGTHSIIADGLGGFYTHKRIRVLDNVIHDMVSSGIRPCTWVDSIVANNQIVNVVNSGVTIAACNNLLVSGNNINNTTGSGIRVGTLGGFSSNNVTVTGNKVRNTVGNALHGDDSNSVIFSHNVVDTIQNRGIQAVACPNIVISSNAFIGVGQMGSRNAIQIDQSPNARITDNIVNNIGFPINYTYAVSVSATCAGTTVNFNKVDKGNSGFYDLAPADIELDKEIWLVRGLSATSGSVTLADDITKYKELHVMNGAVTGGLYTTGVVRPFASEVYFRPGTDFINVKTNSGMFVASIDSNGGLNNQITIKTANDALRAIRGTKY